MIKHAIYVALAFCLAAIILAKTTFARDQIVHPYLSPRTSAMGGVYLTTGLYDQNFFGNPARATANPVWKIQLPGLTTEANWDGVQLIDDAIDEGVDFSNLDETAGNNNHVRVQMAWPSFYWPRMDGTRMSLAIGLVTSLQVDAGLRRTYAIDQLVVGDIGPAITLARTFMKDDALSVGVTGHASYRFATTEDAFGLVDFFQGEEFQFSDMGKDGYLVDFDIGATYNLPNEIDGMKVSVGATINNVMGGKYRGLGDTSQVARNQPRSYGVGIAGRKDAHGILRDTVVAFEITDIGNNPGGSWFRLLHVGGETRIWNVFMPRLGINQGYFCAGLGFDLKVIDLELATYGEEMSLNTGGDQDRRYALRFAFKI